MGPWVNPNKDAGAIDIAFASSALEEACCRDAVGRRKFGTRWEPLRRRLTQIRGALVLADLRFGNPHPLAGDRAGQFAVDVSKNWRLIFEIANNPVQLDQKGGIDLTGVTAVRILEVVDYHA